MNRAITKRRRARANPIEVLPILGIVLGVAAIGGIVYYVTKPGGISGGTQVGSLTNGAQYTVSVVPDQTNAATGDSTLFTQMLQGQGWSNVQVTSFDNLTSDPRVATATWSGVTGAAVPAGETVTS